MSKWKNVGRYTIVNPAPGQYFVFDTETKLYHRGEGVWDDSGIAFASENGAVEAATRANELLAASQVDAKAKAFGPLDELRVAVCRFMNADRSEHLRTRFSDDENDKFDRIIDCLGKANLAVNEALLLTRQPKTSWK